MSNPLVIESGKWIALSGVMSFLAFFSISLGCTTWTVNSEIYPLHMRGVGNSIATTIHWIANYLFSQFFLVATASILG